MELPKLIKKVGAEVIRLWVASENYQQEIRLSDEILTQMQESYRRIRNSIRYPLSNLYDYDVSMAVPFDDMEEIDQWIICDLQELNHRVRTAYDSYEFHQVYRHILNFCSTQLSSFYFDILKDRLYTYAADSPERRSAQTALAQILTDLLKLMAPILAHTCDEAWNALPGGLKTADSVHLSAFPEKRETHTMSDEKRRHWDELLRIRNIVSKSLEAMRQDKVIGSSLEAEVTLAPGTKSLEKTLKLYEQQLPSIFIVSKCSVADISDDAKDAEDGVFVQAEKSKNEKCQRCWNYRDSVGNSESHPEICGRCVEQLGV
jgi:isoleucyl-tRNA synthetase